MRRDRAEHELVFRAYPVRLGTLTQQVFQGECVLGSIAGNQSGPPTSFTLYDGTNASGRIILQGTTNPAMLPGINVRLSIGLYLEQAGAGPHWTFMIADLATWQP